MDDYLKGHTLMDDLYRSRRATTEGPFRFLMFRPALMGQGIGNIMNGLLAAHALGIEFNRVVCISTDWEDFYQAFEPLQHRARCAQLPQNGRFVYSIDLLNFGPPPNECRLQKKLASDVSVYYISGNTYPRWSRVPPGLFEQHYKPTPRLLQMLPYQTPPETVVHLRAADNNDIDPRRGLDPASLQALGQELPRNKTFLVTNNVDWYKYFEDTFGWQHPHWEGVSHSALVDVWWGANGTELVVPHNDSNLQLFSDWYTILGAQHVYHTHSDFSLSAIHWNDIDSKTIQGTNPQTGRLEFSRAPWRVETPAKPLVNRTEPEMKHCSGQFAEGADFMDDKLLGDDLASDYQGINDAFYDTDDNRQERTNDRRVFWGLDPPS